MALNEPTGVTDLRGNVLKTGDGIAALDVGVFSDERTGVDPCVSVDFRRLFLFLTDFTLNLIQRSKTPFAQSTKTLYPISGKFWATSSCFRVRMASHFSELMIFSTMNSS